MAYPIELLNRIRQRAFEIWQYRQEYNVYIIVTKYGVYQNISAQDDWLEAEAEILAQEREQVPQPALIPG